MKSLVFPVSLLLSHRLKVSKDVLVYVEHILGLIFGSMSRMKEQKHFDIPGGRGKIRALRCAFTRNAD